jgi:hypothetical protein
VECDACFFPPQQVKDVLFEPVRKTQDAMFFFKADGGMWTPCGPKQPGAVQTTMQELAAKGLAAQVTKNTVFHFRFYRSLYLQLLRQGLLLHGCRFFPHQSQGRTLRKSSQGRGRQLARRTWRCMRGSPKSLVRRADAPPPKLMHSCSTEGMCIVYDFDCSSWKFDPQRCKLGSLTDQYDNLRQPFHGGLSIFLCCQLVSFLQILVIFHKCIN